MSAEPQGLIQIGEVAERAGLSLRTLRYWDEIGLVSASRSAGGFRLYTETDIDRILVIKSMKPLALTLDEIREVLRLLEEAERLPATADRAALELRLDDYAQRTRSCITRVERDLAYATVLLETLEAHLPARVSSL